MTTEATQDQKTTVFVGRASRHRCRRLAFGLLGSIAFLLVGAWS
jgi:hypothetical protein